MEAEVGPRRLVLANAVVETAAEALSEAKALDHRQLLM
jgi:hypothetical protein